MSCPRAVPETSSPPPAAVAADLAQQPRDRRREKPQLSCVFCRTRKVRCDRRLPCQTCTSKGIALSCTYTTSGPRKANKVSVGDRIQELEALVRSLAQQQQQQSPQVSHPPPATPAVHSEGPAAESLSTPTIHGTSNFDSDTLASPDVAGGDAILPSPWHPVLAQAADGGGASPAPSEPGSLRLHAHGANYVGSVHWAAVLDSISELREHYEEEEEARLLATAEPASHFAPGPRLLYEPLQLTKADILSSLPARPVVDRMVARYFNAQGVAPEILHRGHFLREYETFWHDPAAASIIWVGLLYSIMCVSTQFQQMMEDDPADPDTSIRVRIFRERTVHCLHLGQYTRGGNYVLETMINYLACELLLSKDAEIGLWLVHGVLVQLALSLGYHRDPKNFPNISPFAGEMRRRVWAVIVQVDLRLASQMGLPRLLKVQQCDTANPRNLLDADFDENTLELPPSRPESELTPVLFGLARNRIDKLSGLVSDLVNDAQEHPYTEVKEMDRKLLDAEASLPAIFRWQALSQSFMVPAQVVMHRVWLQLAIHRMIIWLHRKYLAPSYSQAQYEYSRRACVQAAIKILEFQQIVDDETQRDGLLYPVRWMFTSSRVHAAFLLGLSILCYYVRLAEKHPDLALDEETGVKVHSLLRDSYFLWLRASNVSVEAGKAVEHLSILLGMRGGQQSDTPVMNGAPPTAAATTLPLPPGSSQFDAISWDQMTWDAYQDPLDNAASPSTFGTGVIMREAPIWPSLIGAPPAEMLLSNTSPESGVWVERKTGREYE